jgi:hypothetical protein
LHDDGAFAWKTCTFLHREEGDGDALCTIGVIARRQRQLQALPLMLARRADERESRRVEPAIV